MIKYGKNINDFNNFKQLLLKKQTFQMDVQIFRAQLMRILNIRKAQRLYTRKEVDGRNYREHNNFLSLWEN